MPFVLLAGVVALYWLAPVPVGPPFIDDRPGWAPFAPLVVAGVLWLIGVIWMVRIFRGPRDEAARWRYRDRRP